MLAPAEVQAAGTRLCWWVQRDDARHFGHFRICALYRPAQLLERLLARDRRRWLPPRTALYARPRPGLARQARPTLTTRYPLLVRFGRLDHLGGVELVDVVDQV